MRATCRSGSHYYRIEGQASYEDLLACLMIRGLPSEWAACSLYLRTHRRREDDNIDSFVLDHDDWQR